MNKAIRDKDSYIEGIIVMHIGARTPLIENGKDKQCIVFMVNFKSKLVLFS
jgi:hypothetical protein